MNDIKKEPFSGQSNQNQQANRIEDGDGFIYLDKKGVVRKSFKKGVLFKKVCFAFLGIVLLLAISWIAFFSFKIFAVGKKINIENSQQNSVSKYVGTIISGEHKLLDGENDGRINILLLGAAGQHKPGGNLTDTVMVASIDTKNKKVALLSLPRDFYVPIAGTKTYSKINSIYKISLNEGEDINLIKETVEKILDIPINYYLVINFDGFEKVIDNIGGINITNERDIYDTRYPGPNYSYETFELSKGFHKLDGATALKYVRERHDDPDGDFGRAKRQQQVIQAVKNKLFSTQTLLNVVALNDILNTLGDNVRTNVSFDEIESFIALSQEVDMQNITNVVLDAWEKDSLLKVSHIMAGSVRAFILVPRVGSYSEIQDLAENIFNQDELKRRRDEITKEDAQIAIINQSGNSQLPNKIKTLLSDIFRIKNIRIASSYSKEISDRTTVASLSSEEKIFTLDELIKKLPASLDKSSDSDVSSKDDIIILLGKDLVDAYKYETDSIEDFKKYQDSDEYDNLISN